MTYVWHKTMRTSFESLLTAEIDARRSIIASAQVDTTLHALVPVTVLHRLADENRSHIDHNAQCTILFTDLCNFTKWCHKRTAQEVVWMLNVVVSSFDALCANNVEKIKTIGDAYWAVCGLPEACSTHASRMIDFAGKILDVLKVQNKQHREWKSIQMRIGVHTGACSGAVIGTRQYSYEVFGPTSDIANLCEQRALPMSVCVSETTAVAFAAEQGLSEDSFPLEGVDVAKAPLLCVQVPSGTGDGADEINLYVVSFASVASSEDRRRADVDDDNLLAMSLTSLAESASLDSYDEELEAGAEVRTRFIASEIVCKRHASAGEKIHTVDIGDAVDAASHRKERREIEERYTARKWSFMFLDFAAVDVEAEFWRFVLERRISEKIISRFFTTAFILCILLGIAIEGANDHPSKLSLGLLILAFLVALGLSLVAVAGPPLTRIHSRLPLIEELSFYASGTLTLIGASRIGGDTTVGNSVWYIGVIYLSASYVSLQEMCAFTFSISTFLIISVPMLILSVSHPVFGVFATMPINLLFGFYLLIFIGEKTLRQTFRQNALATHDRRVTAGQVEVRRALLETAVPLFVIDRLQQWLHPAVGMDPSLSVQQLYPHACIAFLRLQFPRLDTTSANCDIGDTSPFAALLTAHALIDDVLEKCSSVVVKVKTMGNTLMLASSDFHSGNGAAIAPVGSDARAQFGLQLVQAVIAIVECFSTNSVDNQREEGGAPSIYVGLHCGPVVGAVLGLHRLAFDVFGDAVNVASRVMVGERGKEQHTVIRASTLFIESTETAPQSQTKWDDDDLAVKNDAIRRQIVWSDTVEAFEAKGKGTIMSRTLARKTPL